MANEKKEYAPQEQNFALKKQNDISSAPPIESPLPEEIDFGKHKRYNICNTLTMNKKVYFSGSIRGGRQDASIYGNIIRHIQLNDIVLTEHIGKKDLEIIETGQSDHDIYIQDTNWLKECDLVIAECTQASLGVGYELAFAENLNKPVYILYNPQKSKLSAMLAGNTTFNIFTYQSEEEAFNILDSILA